MELQRAYPADEYVGRLALDALMAVDLQVPDKAEQTAYEFGKPLVEALMGVEGLGDDCIAFRSKSVISGSAGIFQMACVAASGLVDKWDTKIEGNQDEPGSDRDREIASILRRMLHIGSQMALLSSAYTFLPGRTLSADPGVIALRRTMLQLRLVAEIIMRGGLLNETWVNDVGEAQAIKFNWATADLVQRADELARRYRMTLASNAGPERFLAKLKWPSRDMTAAMKDRLEAEQAAETEARDNLGYTGPYCGWEWAFPGQSYRGDHRDRKMLQLLIALDRENEEEWENLKAEGLSAPAGDSEFELLVREQFEEKEKNLRGEVRKPLQVQYSGGNKAVHEFGISLLSSYAFLGVYDLMKYARGDIGALLEMVSLGDVSVADPAGSPLRFEAEARIRLSRLFGAGLHGFWEANQWFLGEL